MHGFTPAELRGKNLSIFHNEEQIKNVERLKALSKLSPVFDVVTNGTRVNVQIEKKEAREHAHTAM